MIEMAKPCLHCKIDAELYTQERVAAVVKEISIAPSLAVEEIVYEKRLKTCNICEALREKVLCAYCGCFILFRARTRKNYCPHPNGDKWECL